MHTPRAAILVLVLALVVGSTASGCDTSYVDSTDQMNEGIKLYNSGQIGKALDHLRKAVELYPENHKAHFQIGMIYNGRLNDYPKAIDAFKRAAEIRSDSGEYWYYLGYAQQNHGKKLLTDKQAALGLEQFRQAAQSLQRATEADQYFAEAYFRQGQVYEEVGEIGQAVDAYSNAINADATLSLAYFSLGKLYAEYSFVDEASQVLRNGVENNPANVQLQGELGNVFLTMEQYQDAIHHFTKAHEAHEAGRGPIDHVLPSLYGMGLAYAALGDQALQAGNVAEAAKQYAEGVKWLDQFIANASGAELGAQRTAATGKAGDMKTMLRDLEQGRVPKVIIDQKKMMEEQPPAP